MVSLTLPDLAGAAKALFCSRPLWLRSDGSLCRAGEPLAAFNVNLGGLASGEHGAFADERTLQVVLASQDSGRLRIRDIGTGGLHDLWGTYEWRPGEPIADLENDTSNHDTVAPMRPMFLAGRRMGWAVDSDAGTLPGWNARARAWWGDRIERAATLVSLGLCDATGIVRGSDADFRELFELVKAPLHVAHYSEHPLVFCAPVLLDQLTRTDQERDAIARDLTQGLADGSEAPAAADFLFVGALINQLNASPLTERALCLTADGATRLGPPRFALLSLLSETMTLHRHKRLGYHLYILRHDVKAAGAATRAMLRRLFEPVELSITEIETTFRKLVAKAEQFGGTRFIVMNRNSSDSRDTVFDYKSFGARLSRTFTHVASKEMNAMLDDLAAEGLVDILDVDARAAELGTGAHVPDGTHYSGELEDVLRHDLVQLLTLRGAIAPAPE